MVKVIEGLVLTYLACIVFVDYWLRNCSKNVIRRFECTSNRIALTFDDGPDEMYTGQLMDLLKKYNVKATFFVVAEKVKKNPQLIDRMKFDGHLVAMHSLKHKNEILSFPWETYHEFKKTALIFNENKLEINYYRPPWGHFNLFNYYFAVKNNMKTVLWTVEAADWEKDKSPEEIFDTLISKCKPGDIIVLHDSGGAKGAPQQTIEALKMFIPSCINSGIKFVTIEEGLVTGDAEGNIELH